MNPDTVTRFGLIRHAPTLWNEQKRIQGQQDSPLSARGRLMAEAWGKQLADFSWNRLICSDLERVQQTARLINLPQRVATDPRLREQNWGIWTGMTLREVKARDRGLLREQEQRGWDFQPPEGESRRTVLSRSLAALTDAHAAWPGEKILVVCHEGILKCLLYHLLGRQFLPKEPKVMQSFHLHLMAMQGDTLTIEQVNRLALAILSVKSTRG